ncbi:tRNA pseudouridine synthase TruD [Methylomonas koyamae]|uniref:tRNA pseudouridine synthase D n=1 Tax=Methylomonas koyamae TaxID=702114 RepID=A0A177NSN9_9GAMM|nr:tRNA pseudouridine(13) synthase TruD [Methylomonas koyamae]OAI20239.1 tRNA pseudouridine synthase TruD [Methylomonas koyamae]
MSQFTLPVWPFAYGGPNGSGEIKTVPDDFIVEEILGFEPEGSGEHVFLFVEKIGENTEYVARLLARHAGVRQRDIGYAGLKDRHGRTRQWFSVWLPGKDDPDWSAVESESLKVLQAVRHPRKLKRGVLAGNRFEILLRNWQGDRAQAEGQLRQIQTRGFPNYFGPQRFGHQGRNIDKALALFGGAKVKREQASIYLSAARSYLFNLILAERVSQGNWDQALAGDIFKLAASNSLFAGAAADAGLASRVAAGEIHPTGVLYGKAGLFAEADAGQIEQAVLDGNPLLVQGLKNHADAADRRALRAIPGELGWEWEHAGLRLGFSLPAGSYATALLRELIGDESAAA